MMNLPIKKLRLEIKELTQDHTDKKRQNKNLSTLVKSMCLKAWSRVESGALGTLYPTARYHFEKNTCDGKKQRHSEQQCKIN